MRDRSAPLTAENLDELAWEKMDGLLPAVVQDQRSGRVLMVGYMDKAALEASLATGFATFFSRSKNRLWKKGETSGNHLQVHSVFADCDGDSLLVLALPTGATCHTGTTSCFGNEAILGPGWLGELRGIVADRARSADETSYTRRLLAEGRGRIAQKIGEEGVEVALAAVSRSPSECVEEIADLSYHLAVLMESLEIGWDDVIEILKKRHASVASKRTASS